MAQMFFTNGTNFNQFNILNKIYTHCVILTQPEGLRTKFKESIIKFEDSSFRFASFRMTVNIKKSFVKISVNICAICVYKTI